MPYHFNLKNDAASRQEVNMVVQLLQGNGDSKLFMQNDCVVSHIGTDEKNIFVTQLRVKDDIPLLESKLEEEKKSLVLNALYENYRRSLTDKVLICFMSPRHVEQIVLTFLFFEAYLHADEICNIDKSFPDKDFVIAWSQERIINNLREQQKQHHLFESQPQIDQAKKNARWLYQYVLNHDEYKKDNFKNCSPHISYLPTFAACFQASKKLQPEEQVKVVASKEIKKPASCTFFQNVCLPNQKERKYSNRLCCF